MQERRIQRSDAVAYRDLREGGVLLRLDTGAYFKINEVGARLWAMLEREPTLDELAGALSEECDDAPPDILDDVRAFVDDLRVRGLVEA